MAESVLDYELNYPVTPAFRLSGEVEAQTDTHLQTDRNLHFSWQDRELRRPAFAMRRLSASCSKVCSES